METQGLLALARAGFFRPAADQPSPSFWAGAWSLQPHYLLPSWVILVPMVCRPVPALGVQLLAPVNGALQPGQKHAPPLGGRGLPPVKSGLSPLGFTAV